jgi:hypothetical protein
MTATPKQSAVELWVSDPFEFGTECGVGPFKGTVVDTTSEALLVRLHEPFEYGGKRLVAAVARPRHVGDSTDLLATTGKLIVNILFLFREVPTLGALSPKEEGEAAVGSAIGR